MLAKQAAIHGALFCGKKKFFFNPFQEKQLKRPMPFIMHFLQYKTCVNKDEKRDKVQQHY